MFWVLNAQEVEIGAGTETERFPLGNYYGFERSAALYTSSEMGNTGNLTSLAWYAETAGLGSRPIKIYLKKVTTSTLAESTWSQMIVGAVEIYNSGMEPIEGWNTFSLVSSFEIAAGENLLVLVEANYGGWGLTGTVGNSVRSSIVSGKHQIWMDDDFAPTEAGELSPNRPNIKLNFGEAPTCFPPVGVSITDISADSAMLSWSPTISDNELGYSYEVRTSGEPGSEVGLFLEGTVQNIEDLPINLEGLELSTTYYVYVKANCTAEDSSSWTAVKSFSTPLATPSPWFEGFAEADMLPVGWSLLEGTELYVDGEGDTDSEFGVFNTNILNSYLYYDPWWGGQEVVAFSTINVGPILEGDAFSFKYVLGEDYWSGTVPGAGSGNIVVEFSTDFGSTYSTIATIPNNGISGFQQLSYDLEDYVGEYLKIKVTATIFNFDYEYAIGFDDFFISSPQSCVFPLNVAIQDSGDTDVTFKWDQSVSLENIGYTYEMRTSGLPGSGEEGLAFTGVITDPMELTKSFEGLPYNTTYYFYIRTNCSVTESSAWSAEIVYSTLPVTTSPWHEGFNTATTPNGWNRSGWSIDSSITGISAPDGTNYIYKNIYGTGGNSSGSFTIIDVGPVLVGDIFSFIYRLKNYTGQNIPPEGSGNFKVEISNDFGETYTEVGVVPNNGLADWQDFSYALEDYYGDYVRIKITGAKNASDVDYYLVFDAFDISRPCVTITGLEMEDIGSNSATVNIDADAISFDIEYGETGFEQGEGTLISGVSSPYELTELEENTEYDVYVRANCGVDNFGEWSDLESFTTLSGSPQTITVTDVTKVYGDIPFIHGTASSELPLTYTIEDETVAEVVAGEIVILKAGTTIITASQIGNGMYLPAEDVEFTLTVNKAPLTVKPDDVIKVYDNTDYVPSLLTYEGFVYDDGASDLLGVPEFSGSGVGAMDVGTYTLTVDGLTSENYEVTFEEGTLLINKANIEGITFAEQTFTYDGEAKSIFITGDLPAGAEVTYENNGKTEVGDYTVIAEIDNGPNYNVLTLEAVLKIRNELGDITFEDATFIYDSTEKSLAISGDLPAGVTVSYEENGQTEAGEYTVTALIDGGDMYPDFSLTATLTIEKASLENLVLADGTFVYDGTAKSLVFAANVVPEGVIVTYTGNGKINAGEYVVTAALNGGNNYTNTTVTADLVITKATLSGVTFNNSTFAYDGIAKFLVVTGTLPTGVSVVYQDNGKVDVGNYTVTAEIEGGMNYEDMSMTATLTIEAGTIDWIVLNDATINYDGTAKSLAIGGTLPSGASVTYTNNNHTDPGIYTVTALIDGGGNYNDLTMTAILTIAKGNINGVSLLGATYAYDGLEKSLAISGTLPAGTSVSYQNNGHTDAGSYIVSATISGGANYNDLVLTATLNITKIPIVGISFENATFVYDGTAKSIFISGTLPAGATVNYQNNNRTNAGVHTVVAIIHGGINYASIELTAILTIQKITQTITFNELGVVILEDTADFQLNAIASSGLPVSYTYTYNGSQPATVSDTGWVDLLQSGVVTITAHQEGNINYTAAAPVTRELTIESRTATIDELIINDMKFVNPAQEINYVVDCGAMVYELNFKVITAQGIVIDPGAAFVVKIPKAGIYRQTIKVTSANGKVVKEYNVIIDKPFEFSQIAHQKFDNTLLINNNPKTNGGYNFVGYQWFKNEELVGEEQVYSVGNNASDLLDPTASYHALLTTKEGDVVRVCPMTITLKGTRGVMLYPSPARVGESLTLQVNNATDNLAGTVMDIYNMKGQLVYSKVIAGDRTIFELPQTIQSGVYIAVIKIDNKQEVIKFIVE